MNSTTKVTDAKESSYSPCSLLYFHYSKLFHSPGNLPDATFLRIS